MPNATLIALIPLLPLAGFVLLGLFGRRQFKKASGIIATFLMLLSTSGCSPNVLAAARRGHELGLRVWAMTGAAPNPLADLADEVIAVGRHGHALFEGRH